MTTALDTQIGGGHYKGRKIQPVEYIHANELGFLEGCIVKRITRWRDKPADSRFQDLNKIKHEVDLLIELESRGEDKVDAAADSSLDMNFASMFDKSEGIDESATECQCPVCCAEREGQIKNWINKVTGAKPTNPAKPTEAEVQGALNLLLAAGVISVVKDGDA